MSIPAAIRTVAVGISTTIMGSVFMTRTGRQFLPGDRVIATSRQGFPSGTVVQLLNHEFVLVRWDGDLLETAHRSQLDPAHKDH